MQRLPVHVTGQHEMAAHESNGLLLLALAPRHAPLPQELAVTTVDVEVVEILEGPPHRLVPPRELGATPRLCDNRET